MPSRIAPRLQIGWQVFQEVGSRPYDTIGGLNVSMVRYESHCATCGTRFEGLATRGNWRKRELTRRCDGHRRVGLYVDNLSPPVPLTALPVWARPRTDPKKLKASLGRRQHHCWLLRKGERLRILEPYEAERRRQEWRERHRASPRGARTAEAPARPSYLD
jgi:hypothetical protein